MKASGGGGVNDALIFSSCDTNEVRSFGIQLPHHNAATWLRDTHHLLRHVEGLGSKHCAEYGHGQIKRMVADPLQVSRIALLKFQLIETRLRGSLVPCVNQVLGDVDSNNFCPQKGERNGRSAVSAA